MSVGRRIATAIGKLHPTCKEVTHLASDSMDRSLSTFDRVRMKLHMLVCERCVRYYRQIRAIHEAFRRHGLSVSEVEQGVNLSAQAKERIKESLHHPPGDEANPR